MNSGPDIVNETRLLIGGFVYVRLGKPKDNRTHWECNRVWKKECKARATTVTGQSGQVTVIKGPNESQHSHPPNREEADAEKRKLNLKRKAETYPDLPPSALLREQLAGASAGNLSQLPERENLKQTIRRVRKQHVPRSPTSLAELEEIPENYRKMVNGEQFLIYDSRDHDKPPEERVLVFSTKKNVEMLASSPMWFLDGTFKVAPHIFTQVFTVLGLVSRTSESKDEVALPLVYALLTSKETCQYANVLQAIVSAAEGYGIESCQPTAVMTDFELAIINACKEIVPDAAISTCFFHFCQSLFRKIQAEGLQIAYNSAEDRTIKEFTHKLAALAFVPIADVECYFLYLKERTPEEMKQYVDYFDATYVNGIPARGRRRAVSPRYPTWLWNQYDATKDNQARTNNVSEEWHNRFQLLMAKNHPDIYACISHFIKEQGDTEVAAVELSLGRKIKAAPKKKWVQAQARLRGIVLNYEELEMGEYLEAIANMIVI